MLEKNTRVNNIIYIKDKKTTKQKNKKLLTNVQNGVRTKLPTMVVKGKKRKLRFQPHES